MGNDIAISVKNLTKTYRIFGHPGDRIKQALTFGKKQYHKEFTALKDVSFEIKKGETVGIIGRNGSGKSTLLQLICGILKPTSGSVEVKGRISALLELGAGFNPEFTGRENVYFQGAVIGIAKEEMAIRFDDIAAFADIGEFIDQPVRTYSSGMFVRLAFAVAIHVDPQILVVDEALAVGDMSFQIKCFAHLRKLRQHGTPIFLVSHDLSTVRSFCDRAIYVDHGECLAIGPTNEVCRQYEEDCFKRNYLPLELDKTKVICSEKTSEKNQHLVSNEIFDYLQENRSILAKKERKGSHSLTIESFVIVDQVGNLVDYIDPKNNVTAYAVLRLKKPLSQSFHFGIQIHDRQGTPLMTVRDSTFSDIISGGEGDALIVSMCFSLPLKAGQYYCQAGVLLFPAGEEYSDWHLKFEGAEIADIIEYAAYFSVLPYKHHYITVPVLNETKMEISALKGTSS